MNNLKASAFMAILAALMLMSQAVAVTSSFGGSNSIGSASVSTSMDMSSDAALNYQDTLSLSGGSIMESSGLYKLDGSDWLNKYSSYHSSDGKIWAAVYAYMDQPSTYEYSVKGGVCSCGSIVALESVKADDANNILYGGFAYNENDYAAVQVAGSADNIVYSNLVGATSKKAVGSQDFSADGASLDVFSWAERGNFANELSVDKSIDDYYSDGTYGPPETGDFEQINQQWAHLDDVDLKSYSSYAISNVKSPYAKQSAKLNDAVSASFGGEAKIGDGTATAESAITNGVDVSYSAKSQGTSSKLTATQSLKADSADSAEFAAMSETSDGTTSGDSDVSKVVKLSYSSSAQDSKGKLTATQSLKANSADSAKFAAVSETSDGITSGDSDVSKVVKLSYSSSAQDSSGALTTSQSLKAKSADSATFGGMGVMGTEYAMGTGAKVISGESLSYSFKAQDSKGVLTGSQSLTAKNADLITRTATAESGKGTGQEYTAKASVSVEADLLTAKPILATMKSGSDSLTVKEGYATITQKINANGGSIFRDIGANDGTLSVDADTSIFENDPVTAKDRVPAKATSLNGKSTITIDASGISLKGSWKAYLPYDVTDYGAGDDTNSFNGNVYADNGANTPKSVLPVSSTDKAKSFSFKETASATTTDVEVNLG